MNSAKLRVITASLMCVLLASSPAIAATCSITGQHLLSAYAKAKGNGFKFQCSDSTRTHKGFYSLPGRLGCKGRKTSVSKMVVFLFTGKKVKNGWKISDVTARGSGTISKSLGSEKLRLIVDGISFMAKYDIYITKIKLKHASKSCNNNLNVTLTDAFGS